jgi:hypothetical protein
MKSITPEELGEYRLVKITYDHTIKDYETFERRLDDEDMRKILTTHRHCSVRIRKRNKLIDWIWSTEREIGELLELLDRNEIRHKLVDNTIMYYREPEKLAALRNEIDDFLSTSVNVDFILDRITLLGIDNITKFERKILEKESK